MKVILALMAAACFSIAGWAQASGSSDAQSASVAGTQAGAAQASAGTNAGASGQASQRTDRAVSGSAQSSAGMNAQANAGGASASLSADTTIDAELTKTVDARKAKPGEEVAAKVRNDVRQDGKVILRRGTKLIGHVTQAQARAGGQANSQLGIVFDRAEIKGGQSLELHAAIQALAPAARASYDDAAMSDVGTSPSAGRPMGTGGGLGTGGGALGSAGGAVAGATNTVGGVAQGAGGAVAETGRAAGRTTAGAAGSLNASSHGVLGMPGLQMSSELSNTTNGTVLVSNDKDIRLDSGTQMVLRVMGQSGASQP